MQISLVEVSYILLFTVAVSSLYSIIVSNKTNRLVTFFLVPLIIGASVVSFYAIHSLQGRAIYKWPEGKIQVVSLVVEQPTIWLLVVHEGDNIPTYYGVEWSPQTARELQRQIQERMDLGLSTEGEFKKPREQSQNSGIYAAGPRYWQPIKPKKQIRKEDQ